MLNQYDVAINYEKYLYNIEQLKEESNIST
jgi:hypothetical protein